MTLKLAGEDDVSSGHTQESYHPLIREELVLYKVAGEDDGT